MISIILHPNPIAIIFNERDFVFFVNLNEVETVYGKYHLQRNGISKLYCLDFTGELRTEAFRQIDDRLSISGKSLIQLMMFHAWRYGDGTFKSANLKLFFEGKSLNCVETYMQHVGIPLLLGTPLEELPGSLSRYTVGRERAENGGFLRDIGAPVNDASFNGKRS